MMANGAMHGCYLLSLQKNAGISGSNQSTQLHEPFCQDAKFLHDQINENQWISYVDIQQCQCLTNAGAHSSSCMVIVELSQCLC